ncbi:MAG TPA: hypothetical protein VKB75_01200 [Jatrophihabitans sp.]|nr:hypothetical protein [Jatrophihabitans sp.]
MVVLVLIVVAVVLVGLVVLMKWADRRDRAKGHINRGMGDISSTIRASKMNTRAVRSIAGRQAGVSPHEFAKRLGKKR